MPVSRSLWESITGSGSSSDKEPKKERVDEKPKKEQKEGMLERLNKALRTPPGGY